ncbi:MAG: LOG family protein [Chloracidobacterium sp.]|nr:LOG family protein [Chloracidobacterium sp.]
MNSTNDKIITIFGGSKCTEDSHEYQEAMALGSKLADAGYTICTGGYLGIMEAASRGAREKGGRVLGIVMNQFKSEPNRFLTDKVATDHFYDRLQNLILRSSGFVAFRGGMGTVTEVSLVWKQVADAHPRVAAASPDRGLLAARGQGLADFARRERRRCRDPKFCGRRRAGV